MKVVLLLVLSIVYVHSTTLLKPGDQVVQVTFNKTQVDLFLKAYPGVDVWTREGNLAVGQNTIHVNQEELKFMRSIGGKDLLTTIPDLFTNVQEQHESSIVANAKLENMIDYNFDTYLNFNNLMLFFSDLCEQYDNLCGTEEVGKSIDGNKIVSYRITGAAFKKRGIPTKPTIFFSGCQHAREWISPHTLAYIYDRLLKGYGNDDAVTKILDDMEIIFVPVVNPDGYLYTWQSTSTRLWRKNRRSLPLGYYGVDLNRNWDFLWGVYGSSSFYGSETYKGEKAFSEPESKALSEYFTKLDSEATIIAAIDWHAYSQLILRPYGDEKNEPPAKNEKQLNDTGAAMAEAIKEVHGKEYENIPSWQLYPTSGTASDWYFDPDRTPLSYTFELRPTPSSNYGFQLPATQIRATGEENYAAALVFAKEAWTLYEQEMKK